MKPIRLEIAGLQSYRESQTVDFERLCEGGVFGIFGPTGSGKSSILDAMTLALYGKVERAVKGTQGIMNGAENKLSVSFTFELSGAGETDRYRVERQYKRAGETSVHGAICRLVQVLPEGDVVIADKQNEVDAGVVKLIGLEMPDFTRAVVLPQGKFAEFLSLAGKDRRQMLQRLFRLERYGDVLAARLSARSDKVKLALKEAEAEQHGLGDASPEALQAAAERLAQYRAAAAGLRLRLTKAEAGHAEIARRRENQVELQRLESQLASLAERSEEMADKEQRIERLDKAAELAPLLAEADEAEITAVSCRTAKSEAERLLAIHKEEAEQTSADWSRLGDEAALREPGLLVQLERLEQALRIERENEQLAQQRAVLEKELVRLEEESVRLGALLSEQEDLLTRGRSKQSALKEQLSAVLPSAERSVRLQTAVSKREQWESMSAQEAESAKEEQETLSRLKAAEERQAHTGEAFGESYREGVLLQAWWNGMSEEVDGFRQGSEVWLAESAAASERLRERERENEREHLAHLLAESLAEGQPCPVCGSCAHPVPAERPELGGSDPLREEMQALAESVRRIGQLDQEAVSWSERVMWYRNRLSDRLRHPAMDLGSVGEGTLEAAPSGAETDSIGVIQNPTQAEDRWKNLQDRLKELTGRHDKWETEYAHKERELTQSRDAAASLLESARQAAGRRQKLAEQAASFARAWHTEFPDLPSEEIRAMASEAANAELTARDLRERLDKSIGFLEEQERKYRDTERNGHEVSLRLTEAKARKEGADAAFAAAESRLREWTGGQSASVLSEQTKKELEQLRTAAADAKSRSEAAERKRQETLRLFDTAAERDQSASAALERVKRRLNEGLAASLFASADEVRQLVPLLPESDHLKEEVETYRRSEMQLSAQRKLLQERMSGEPVTPEVWEQSLSVVETLRQQTEEALAFAAKAERDADDLSSRRERWEQLEERRSGLAAVASRISQLQSVFRGNAFVEYIAEEQLEQVCLAASERLGFLTRRRYALEVDANGGFVIRDDANGGLRRPVSTLSGGETFLTSLALALALSAQIQLQGKYPLQFFFLDEGFGTLDPELLDTVITSLEKLQHSRLAVGVISHVPELQARLPRRLHVTPAEPGGRGSRIIYETM